MRGLNGPPRGGVEMNKIVKKAKLGPPGLEVLIEVRGCDECPFGPVMPGQEYCLRMNMKALNPEDKSPYPVWCPLEDWE